jgi:hypothetical protein
MRRPRLELRTPHRLDLSVGVLSHHFFLPRLVDQQCSCYYHNSLYLLSWQQNCFHLAPLLGSSLPHWSTELITQFLDLSQAVGLLGQVVSSSQGLYLNTGQHKYRKTRTYIIYRCPRRDSNPQSRPPSDRRWFMPQTSRLPRPTWQHYRPLKGPLPL